MDTESPHGVSVAIEAAWSLLRDPCGERLHRDFSLAPLTSFRIGGRAALFLEAAGPDDLAAASRAVRATRIPLAIIGKGSNVLVSDSGFDGLVLRLGKGYRWMAREGNRLRAGGATPLPVLAGVALQHGLTGLEFGVAIPASLGGAVWMNAGAHGASIGEVVHRVHLFLMDRGETTTIAGADAGFAYRRSSLPPDAVVTGADLTLSPGDPRAIRERMREARAWRRATQPLAEANCGSVFKNPEGDYAARLVEAVGGKSVSSGNVRVSEKHANFIVAGDGATAADVAAVIVRLQELVAERFGIVLTPEVQFIGAFSQRPR